MVGLGGAFLLGLGFITVLWLRLQLNLCGHRRQSGRDYGEQLGGLSGMINYTLLVLSVADIIVDMTVCRRLFTRRSLFVTGATRQLPSTWVMCAQLAAGDMSECTVARSVSYLSLVFLVAPFLLSILPLVKIVRAKRLIDDKRFSSHAAFYSSILFLSLSNLDLLRLIPWQTRGRTGEQKRLKWDGFPSMQVMVLTTFTTLFEDLPQLILQVSLVLAAPELTIELAVALGLSATFVVWRSARLMAAILLHHSRRRMRSRMTRSSKELSVIRH